MFDVVCIRWLDAVSVAEWKGYEDLESHGLYLVITCGFLVAEFPDRIIVAATVTDTEYSDAIAIPKTWIKEQKVICEKRKTKNWYQRT